MANHPHTIDRWDDATGENLIEQIASVGEEACSRKEFFDELADNLEARSDRYTHQSGPGIIALF
jgi:hypothetical protein